MSSFPERAHAKPIIRWVGGKRWLVPIAAEAAYQYLERTRGRYFEPFLGGGAVALDLGLPHMQLSDFCRPLIHALNQAKRYPSDVYMVLQTLRARGVDAETYYEIRNEKPRSYIERAARFFYLSALAWNGVYRENSKGKFNVPFANDGRQKSFVTLEALNALADALSTATLLAEDFRVAIARAERGDFLYADSPYYGVYSSYLKEGFSEQDQVDLAKALRAAHNRGVAILATNADRPEVRHLYKWAHLQKTSEARNVNSDGKGRGKTPCLLIASSPDLVRDLPSKK